MINWLWIIGGYFAGVMACFISMMLIMFIINGINFKCKNILIISLLWPMIFFFIFNMAMGKILRDMKK